MVYLVDTFGILGSGQSPRFTVSEKRRRERGNTTHSQWEKLTRIRDTPVTCGHRTYCEETEGKRERVEGPPQGWLDEIWMLPQTQGAAASNPKPCQGHGLTNSRSFCKPNP